MTHTYALIGLTPSERALLESLFSLDTEPGEELVAVRKAEEADLIIANGDDRSVVETLRQANPHALLVLVGTPVRGQPPSGLPVLRRPLDMSGVAAVLSTLDWPDQVREPAHGEFDRSFFTTSAPPSTVAPETVAPSVPHDPSAFADTTATAPLTGATGATLITQRAKPDSAMAQEPVPAPAVSARHTWAVSEAAALARHEAPAAPMTTADILVVSLLSGRREPTLPRGLRRLGYRVAVVGIDDALTELARRTVPFVFLDQASLGEHLLPLARRVNAGRAMPGQAPHLVVVARQGSTFDRLRARMAGCVWMHVPVDRERLIAFLARRGLHRPD